LMPEATHMLMWAMSDRAIPRSFRMMEGFGIHTFRMVNAKGKSTFVKFHWKPKLGLQSLLWDEALKLQAADNDYHRRDLFEAIAAGNFPEWELGIQAFDEKFAEKLPYDVLERPRSSQKKSCLFALLAVWCWTGIPITSSRRPSRLRTARLTSFRVSILPTIRFCKAVCSAISIHRNRASEQRTSINFQ
jgi:hypothetical protein